MVVVTAVGPTVVSTAVVTVVAWTVVVDSVAASTVMAEQRFQTLERVEPWRNSAAEVGNVSSHSSCVERPCHHPYLMFFSPTATSAQAPATRP